MCTMFLGLELFLLYFLYDALVSEGKNKLVKLFTSYYYSYRNVYRIMYFLSSCRAWLVRDDEQTLGRKDM